MRHRTPEGINSKGWIRAGGEARAHGMTYGQWVATKEKNERPDTG